MDVAHERTYILLCIVNHLQRIYIYIYIQNCVNNKHILHNWVWLSANVGTLIILYSHSLRIHIYIVIYVYENPFILIVPIEEFEPETLAPRGRRRGWESNGLPLLEDSGPKREGDSHGATPRLEPEGEENGADVEPCCTPGETSLHSRTYCPSDEGFVVACSPAGNAPEEAK